MTQQQSKVIQELDGVRLLEVFQLDGRGSSKRIGFQVDGAGADPSEIHSQQLAEDEYLRRLWK